MALTEQKRLMFAATLENELKAAMGCTEPIAIAYCAAYARKTLGEPPIKFEVACSGNIIKNVNSVVVPQTHGMHGIEVATLAGAIGGDPEKKLEVLSTVTEADVDTIKTMLDENAVSVSLLESNHLLHIIVTEHGANNTASVEIIDSHTNIGDVYLNGTKLHSREQTGSGETVNPSVSFELCDIIEFADTVKLSDVNEVIDRQIEYNTAICEEGLKNDWGAMVGKTLRSLDTSLKSRLISAATAGSDARMNGCSMPVVINSGSGNQGITVSVPVIEYARENNIPRERLTRALVMANLVALYQKEFIGKLSAFCGATSAAAGAAAGIAYLDNMPQQCIAGTVTNTIATVGGMVCDGAKSSCATKIYTALSCALMGYKLAQKGIVLKPGDGIVKSTLDKTVRAVGRIASNGMALADREILNIMLEN